MRPVEFAIQCTHLIGQFKLLKPSQAESAADLDTLAGGIIEVAPGEG
jgi:hypothetical protein